MAKLNPEKKQQIPVDSQKRRSSRESAKRRAVASVGKTNGEKLKRKTRSVHSTDHDAVLKGVYNAGQGDAGAEVPQARRDADPKLLQAADSNKITITKCQNDK